MTSYGGSYFVRKVVQAETSCSNDGMNRGSIIAVVIGVNSICVLLWNAITFALVYCTGPLIVVYMAKEN